MKLTLGKTECIEVRGGVVEGYKEVLTTEAMEFVAGLQRKFGKHREALLEARAERGLEIKQGLNLTFPKETAEVRNGDWKVAPIPNDLQDRRTEITGPVDRKMVINALNSGAKVFMADFEDANSPTWANIINGQLNLRDAVRREVDFVAPNGKAYSLNEEVAVLKVRPRGWHLEEKHFIVDGKPISASIFDFGLYFYHNAQRLLEDGSGPYFYLPKLENYKEARLWNSLFEEAQSKLGISNGRIKVTVLIETITASLEMEEIIYELKDHMAGLNAGRWDYIFSAIKKFGDEIFPDRNAVTMTVPFMDAYARQLVKVCHKRGAHAIGGMAAFIPSKDPEVNKMAFEKVKADKEREVNIGYDGTWVAHPHLVKVAMDVFDGVLGDRPNQKEKQLDAFSVEAAVLLNFKIASAQVTEGGVRHNINVGILYIASWLRGVGAAAIYNLMEDAATAEISRTQVWQWLHHNVELGDTGKVFNHELYDELLDSEVDKIKKMVGLEEFKNGRYPEAVEIFDDLVTKPELADFLTLRAYEHI